VRLSGCRDSSAGVATSYGLDGPGSISSFSFLLFSYVLLTSSCINVFAFCILYYLCVTVYVLLIVYVTLPPGKAQLQLVINIHV
jgi:hypothetical protein